MQGCSANGGDQLPTRVIAIDVGAGTQDILIYECGTPFENAIKMVLPSQTKIVGGRIRAATEAGIPIHLAGTIMGGGASGTAIYFIKMHQTAYVDQKVGTACAMAVVLLVIIIIFTILQKLFFRFVLKEGVDYVPQKQKTLKPVKATR